LHSAVSMSAIAWLIWHEHANTVMPGGATLVMTGCRAGSAQGSAAHA
jgi:hypothetical protein